MEHRLRFAEVVCQSKARADSSARVHEVEVVIPNSRVGRQVPQRRKVVLRVQAGLPALAPAAERWKNFRVSTAVEEEAFSFAQPHEIDARSEEHTSELQSPDHLVCR